MHRDQHALIGSHGAENQLPGIDAAAGAEGMTASEALVGEHALDADRRSVSFILKFVKSADIVEGLSFHSVAVMSSGLWRFSGIAFVNQLQIDFFELQSASKAEHKPELILPCIAVKLGCGDYLRQCPTGATAFGLPIILDSLSDPGRPSRQFGKLGFRW
jgi:hypothetical protein